MAETYRLSVLDEIIPPLYSAFILAFPCRPADQEHVISLLTKSWEAVLNAHEVLNGGIEFNTAAGLRNGSLKVQKLSHLSESFVRVSRLTTPDSQWGHSYQSLKAEGMPCRQMEADILAPPVSAKEQTHKVVFPQINLIPGGILLAFCTSHSFTDAMGCFWILNHWAKCCQALDSGAGSNEMFPQHLWGRPGGIGLSKMLPSSPIHGPNLEARSDLWNLLGLHDTENLNIEPKSALAPLKPFQHIPAVVKSPEGFGDVHYIFRFAPEKILKLKEACTPNSGTWVSSNDSLVALVWRTIMRARFPTMGIGHLNEKAESIVSVAVDGRKLLDPPLFEPYVGNVVFCGMTHLPLFDVISASTPLSDLATAIRKNVQRVKNASLLQEAIDLSATIRDTSALKIAFNDFGGKDLVTTSWMDIPFYQLDFGERIGKPEYFRIPNGQFGGICCLLPRGTDGSVELSVMLPSEQMSKLMEDAEFRQYADMVCQKRIM